MEDTFVRPIRFRMRVTPVLAIVATVVGACTAADDDEATTEKRSNLYLHGNTWPNGVVDVCYDSVSGNNPTLLTQAQLLLANSWSLAANISFTGWGPCNYQPSPQQRSFVSIVFAPGTNGDSSWIGMKSAPGAVGQCGLSTSCYAPGNTILTLISNDTSAFQQQFRYEVIHEFGHALGFDHEQERPDNWNLGAPVYCPLLDDEQGADSGGTYLTSYFDRDSIMNYCSSEPLAGGLRTLLSSGDIYGARQAYGRNTSSHGFMIRSDTWLPLAVNAWGGAAEGTVIKLSDACTSDNPDCTWSYQYGMIVSDKDPSLAIKAWGGAAEGTVLKLARNCSRTNQNCTWTYRQGEFLSDANPNLAINAWGGAQNGTTLLLTGLCDSGNPDCRWTMEGVMLSSARNSSAKVNAFGGAGIGTDLKLHSDCNVYLPDCTWTFTSGMIRSTTNANLALRPAGGASNLNVVELAELCNTSDPNCRWTWTLGQLVNDNSGATPLPINAVGGGVHLAPLKLNNACGPLNADCVFSGFFAY